MIRIGLAGWGDHDDLYPARTPAKDKLAWYAKFFNVVEVDSSFYAVLGEEVYRRWLAETPSDFTFIIKAYQGMTGHSRGKTPFGGPGEMFQAYLDSIHPVVESGRLKAVMFQFPPWFDCTAEHVRQLRAIRKWMGNLPLALEFRHQSWFTPANRERTLEFMRQEGWIHIVCDEPQIGQGSVPTVLEPTDPELTIVRMHGRNAAGWSQASAPNWREIRTLYRYSLEELQEWVDMLNQLLSKGTQEICMIFNNNSGGDAASNALDMMGLLGQSPRELPPHQIDLFGGWED
ncbi:MULTISPECIES: DUF72 domain-containing protein [Paenibacillus]|jgi:uncharacterized protein YecE (DUF72 family)|uniref:Uncharacterized conserved protein YecE, DUF72 family n=1 Tax=Paenibacillus barengoltzii J12 TaxID=935846 RepID=A0ABY1LSC1_9BACL|nr:MULTISPECIES: DUF72 domain-containing protein [Paenibacillus]MDU0331575.1 DUF72 domain-containing protein [Paenibacillus sp. 3LSP]MEC2346853.1 DUF72 domain-containing protein [Paenibacillus barengoltzii]SME94240.1 Uncharacterized conserved protein YecE, DUF72 family [Paenibacillus barengoltzii J12]